MNPLKKSQGKYFTEGGKRYNVQYNVGTVKYLLNFHDGVQKHKDGSDFFGIKIFKNKRKLETAIKELKAQGYIEGSATSGWSARPIR